MLFQLKPLRFTFTASDPVHFPVGQSANILRGAFGTIFRRIICLPSCPGAINCVRSAECPYARFFEPTTDAVSQTGPSGFADRPRSFVLRAMYLDRTNSAPGQNFHFDLILFDMDPDTIGHLVETFGELAREGLGRGRGKLELSTASYPDELPEPEAVIYETDSLNL